MPSWYSRAAKRIPDPTGPYNVGCFDFMCNYENQSPATKGSFLRLFYPAKSEENLSESERLHRQAYWFPKNEYFRGLVGFMNLPRWLGRLLSWSVGHVRIPATMSLPLSTSPDLPSRLPCIVFSHGLGGNRLLYSTYCCELASHGCIVAAVEHRDLSASATYVLNKDEHTSAVKEEWLDFYHRDPNDNEFQLRNSQVRSSNVVKSVNQLLTFLSIFRVAQHLKTSLKIAHWTWACLREDLMLTDLQLLDTHLEVRQWLQLWPGKNDLVHSINLVARCGVALDVWMLPLDEDIRKQDLTQPLLFINTYHFHNWRDNADALRKFIDVKPDTRPVIAVRRTTHMSQCDVPFLLGFYVSKFKEWKSDHLAPEIADGLFKKAMWAFITRHLAIGEPLTHEPIIDGGENIPENVIIGFENESDSKL
ncbi:platelet-activating factor acetylhydrolase isoform X1 [Nematostella vectensis]|uniref:platelet-activating factor acetylhydrolase isoform X1 n=1 Tax=Nematostella vectensis TaxID=45351 RepID=UPI0020770352|nr:platelet-activating factor acetylhydrolase isoform X1 [Nematostella vectensis]